MAVAGAEEAEGAKVVAATRGSWSRGRGWGAAEAAAGGGAEVAAARGGRVRGFIRPQTASRRPTAGVYGESARRGRRI